MIDWSKEPIIKGYKATNRNMTCQGHEFKLGVWYEVEGDIKMCEKGFHFCKHLPGVYTYYPNGIAFECEAQGVLETTPESGTDAKYCAKRIRLVRKIELSGHYNSGNRNNGNGNSGYSNNGNGNSGDGNSGNRNSGYRNSGDGNSGYRNSGDGNSGNRNSGEYNSGYRNSGDGNSGDYNSGDYNSGYRNSGDGNSGDYNSGDYNSGYGNATDLSSGFFNSTPQKVMVFDVQTELTAEEFMAKYPQWRELCGALLGNDPIPFEPYKDIPGITKEKLAALHAKHQAARRKKEEETEE